MRRFAYLLLLVLFVSASASCVSASTDCERWFATYRQELAHSRQVQRIAAAKRRAKLYAQRKIALVQPNPTPKPKLVRTRSPRMNRQEALNHFNLACGVLPDGGGDEPLVSEETPGAFNSDRPLNDAVDLLPAGPGGLIAENSAPLFPSTGGFSPDNPSGGGPSVYTPGFGGSGGGFPSGGSPGKSVPVAPTSPKTPSGPPSAPPSGPPSAPPSGPPSAPPSGPTSAPPSGPPSAPPSGPPLTTPPPPPVSVVPEPASYIYLLTGLAGAAGAIRRRFKA